MRNFERRRKTGERLLTLATIALVVPQVSWAITWRDNIETARNYCTANYPTYNFYHIVVPNVPYGPFCGSDTPGQPITAGSTYAHCYLCFSSFVDDSANYYLAGWEGSPVAPTIRPDPTPNQKSACGSIIHTDSRAVGESVPLVGTPWSLTYFSDRVIGRAADYTLHLPIVQSSQYSYFWSVRFKGQIAGVSYDDTVSRDPNTYQFPSAPHDLVWDGKDSSGNTLLGSRETWITRVETYDPNGPWGAYTINEFQIYGILGNFQAKLMGLGGWMISVHHFWDQTRKMVYLGDGSVQKASQPATVYGTTRYVVSTDQNEVYAFDSSSGRHLQTLDAKTGATKLTFAYDSSGRLSTITDAFSNVTTVQRNGSGVLTGIQGPYGQVTTLTLDSNGYLASITNPNSEVWTMTYSGTGGLLHTFEKPGGQVSTFTYDSEGLLTNDSSSAGNSQTLAQTALNDSQYRVTRSTALSRTTSSDISVPGTSTSRTDTDPQGVVTTMSSSPKSIYPYWFLRETAPDVDSRHFQYTEPRFAVTNYSENLFVNDRTIATSQSSWHYHMYPSVSGGSYPFGYTSIDYPITVNSQVTHDVYTRSTGQTVRTSPVGRVSKWTRSSVGKLTQTQHASYDAVNYSYDSHGRLSGVSQNTRSASISYNSNGYMSSITDPASQTTSFTYDGAGRVLTQTLPDSRVITYTYDDNGNITSVETPSSHTFSFTNNNFDLVSQDTPPALSGPTATNTTYAYNNDKQLTQISRPDGNNITLNYHSTGGQLTSIVLPTGQGQIDYTYSSGKVATVQSSDGIKNEFSYNGYQVKQDVFKLVSPATTLSTLAIGHNDQFDVSSSALTPYSGSTSTINFGYDNDFLLTSAGSETLTRSSSTGFITAVTLSNIVDSRSYDSLYGELSAYSATYTVTPTTLFSQSFTRDSLGRISSKSETVNGTTHTYAYTYDSAGRLVDVDRDSANYSDYTYDSNSNRTSGHVGGVSFSATVDVQDRLTAYNDLTFAYNLNGERTSRTDTTLSLTTSYTYDELGRLKTVTLPNADVISYLVDGQGRRVGRKLNGSVTGYYVYEDQLRIGAVLTSGGAISQRFVYGSKANVPDYMTSGGTNYRIISDERGSVRLVVNASTGAISQQLEYDEFGNVLSDSNPGFQPFGFAGCLYDNATQLCHFGAREYDARVGRWLTKDPLGFGGGDTNLYGYVVQDPINFIDPYGLSQQQIDQGVAWLRSNMPFLFNGLNPTFTDSSLPHHFGAAGATLSPSRILIDSEALNSLNGNPTIQMASIIGTIAHELVHAQIGGPIDNLLFFKGDPHDLPNFLQRNVENYYMNSCGR